MILFRTLIFGLKEEEELIVNPQQEPNKEELSKHLPYCYFLLKSEGNPYLFSSPMGWALDHVLLPRLPHFVLIVICGVGILPLCFRRGNGLKVFRSLA